MTGLKKCDAYIARPEPCTEDVGRTPEPCPRRIAAESLGKAKQTSSDGGLSS